MCYFWGRIKLVEDLVWFMVRAISLFAMTGLFLTISPNLRNSLSTGYTQVGTTFELYSPYSYVALGVGFLAFLMLMVARKAQPRG